MRSAWALFRCGLLWLACGVASAVGPALAAEPSITPQLRVVQEMHNAPVGQIRTDASFTRLFSVSLDKTLRIWRLADLQALRTVYLPSEPGLEGTPYGLAVSRDGKQVFVGGVTGFQWKRAAHIYRIDGERGRIEGTLGRFDNDAIVSLDLSPDGQRLAVGLAAGGLRVIDAQSGAVLHSDAAYAGQVTFVHFASDGRLASTSTDGCVRIYKADLSLAFRNQYPPTAPGAAQCTGSQLGGIRFSPDGRLIAFGVRYKAEGERYQPEVTVMDATVLTTLRVIRPTERDQQSLCCIAWSPDSRTLYVNGNVERDDQTPIYRIRDVLKGPLERWNVGRQQIANMLPLPGGQIVFATTVPSLVKVNANGEVVTGDDGRPMAVLPDNLDFHRRRNDPEALRLSADGRSVVFGFGSPDNPQGKLRANLGNNNLIELMTREGVDDPALRPARRSGVVKVETATGVYAHRTPTKVNGTDIALDAEENIWSWAVHAERPMAALGTQWRLRLVDARGRPMPGWESPPYLSAAAYQTAITADGKMVVVAVGDGTLRWFSVEAAREVLGFFPHANGSDWVAWRGDGFYASSPHGDQYVGWLVNRGEATSPDFYRAVQYERRLYRPDLVRAVLADAAAARRASEQLATTLRQLAAPRVVIDSIQPSNEPGSLTLRFTAEATGRPISEIGVFVDGVPVLPAADRVVERGDGQKLSRTLTVRVASARATVRVEAETDQSLGVDESVPLVRPRAASRRVGRLWVLAAGVSQFDASRQCQGTEKTTEKNKSDCRVELTPLPNTTHDARELAALLARQNTALFSEVKVRLLTEDSEQKPTRANILSALKELEKASADDTVVVFFASHGFASGSASGEYHFVTRDATQQDLFNVVSSMAEGPGAKATREATRDAPSLLSSAELYSLLRRVPGRRVLALDTCHSGAADGRSNPYALFKRSASAQIAVLSASQGNEQSYDVAPAAGRPGHGVFTQALMEALQGQGIERSGDGVTLDEAFRATGPRVAQILKDKRIKGTQTPTLTATPALAATVLSRP